MVQEIHNWVNEEERKILIDYIFDNQKRIKELGPDIYQGTSKDSLTGRWTVFNFLSDPIISTILSPKIYALTGNCKVSCWANIFNKGEGIEPHNHGPYPKYRFSGNLFLTGPDIGTSFASKTYKNQAGTLQYFPCTVVHWVDPNPFDEPRVSMAFDFVYKDTGHPATLVEIKAEQESIIKAAW